MLWRTGRRHPQESDDVTASASQYGFTELLLLAVDKNKERKGLGRSLVAYVHECARAAGSECLIVLSNGHKPTRTA